MRIRNQWYSMCADLVNTRNAGVRRNSIERQTKAATATEDSLVIWRTQIWQLRNPKIRMDLPDPVNAVFQADAFRVRPVEAPGKSGGLPLFRPSLKIQRMILITKTLRLRSPRSQRSSTCVLP